MRLVLLGSPGAGKGTLGERVTAKYRIPHISTGDIIREAIATQSKLGRQVNVYATKGDLVPDELMIKVVYERINKPDCLRGWILDGFPRTVRQAEALDLLLAENSITVKIALEIRISEEEAIQRIIHRRICSQCGAVYNLRHYGPEGKETCDLCGGQLYRRVDDNEATVRQRFGVYGRQTHPVTHYYARDGRLFSVEGNRSVDDVFKDVDNLLQKFTFKEAIGDAQ